MATNQVRFIKNLITRETEPLVMLGLFQAGLTQAIKRGELLEKTASGNTKWVPMDSDYAMSGDVAIANEEIKVGDFAGYYEIIVPRPGDVFEFALDAAGNSAIGTSVYWSSSEVVTVTAGSNVIGKIVGQQNYPKQGHTSVDASGDAGTALRNISRAWITIKASCSYYAALQV